MFRFAAGKGVLRRQVRVRHVVDAGQKRAEHLAVGDDAADRDAAEVDAVIAALAADQAEARAVALGAVVGERDLQRRIDRFRTGVGIENMVHAFGRDIHQAICELEGLGVAELEGRRIVELARLLADRLGDLRATMARVDAPQTCRSVQNRPTVMGRVVHVLGADEQARFLLELPVGGERHPEGAQIIRGVETVRHCSSPRSVLRQALAARIFYPLVKLSARRDASSLGSPAQRACGVAIFCLLAGNFL
ncbi:hypothetical protein D9M72_517030 [compost metagenome]